MSTEVTEAQKTSVTTHDLRKAIANALGASVHNVSVRITSGDEWDEIDATIQIWRGEGDGRS